MNTRMLAFAIALPLCAALAAPALASGHGAGRENPTTLEQVDVAPHTVVRVDCSNAMWPTARQVARHTGQTREQAVALRAQILAEGRRACAQGSTHVLVGFNDPARPADEIAMVVPER